MLNEASDLELLGHIVQDAAYCYRSSVVCVCVCVCLSVGHNLELCKNRFSYGLGCAQGTMR